MRAAAPPAAIAPPFSTTVDPTPVDTPPALVDPDAPSVAATAEIVAQALLGSTIGFAWSTRSGLLVLTSQANQAVEMRRELPYPAAGREAAEMGRVVLATQVWHATRGKLTRVLSTPTQLRPLDCIADEDCTLLDLPVRPTDDGAVVVDHGACPAAIAELRKPGAAEASTWEAYDAAIIPALCRRPDHFGWNGKAFVPFLARAPTSEQVAPIPLEHIAERLLATLLDAPAAASMLQTTTATDGVQQHVLVLHAPERPTPSFVAGVGASAAWASGRALQVAEVWLAGHGTLRRTLQVPVALRALAEPLVVTRLPVELHGDTLQVGDPGAPCRAESGFDPGAALDGVEAEHAAHDRAAARQVCAGRGTYRFTGATWTRTATAPSSR